MAELAPPRRGEVEGVGLEHQYNRKIIKSSNLFLSAVKIFMENSPSGLWRTLGKRVELIALAGSNPAFSANEVSGNERANYFARVKIKRPEQCLF